MRLDNENKLRDYNENSPNQPGQGWRNYRVVHRPIIFLSCLPLVTGFTLVWSLEDVLGNINNFMSNVTPSHLSSSSSSWSQHSLLSCQELQLLLLLQFLLLLHFPPVCLIGRLMACCQHHPVHHHPMTISIDRRYEAIWRWRLHCRRLPWCDSKYKYQPQNKGIYINMKLLKL